MSEIQSTNIRIIGLNEDRTKQSDTASGLRHIYLQLSAAPPRAWSQLFVQIHDNSFYMMKRRAWIEHDYIVIDCVPEEIASQHLPVLKQEVAKANSLYDEHLAKIRREQESQAQQEEKEKERIRSIKSGLNFD